MANRISSRQLIAYRALMKTGSVTRAADALNLSQPTISRQISMLEESIRFKLFERLGNNRLVPSELGERFYREIEGTLNGLEEISRIARGIEATRRSRIRVFATAPVLNSDFFIAAIDSFRSKAPEVQLRLQWSLRPHIEAAVVGRQADIGLAAGPTEHPALVETELLEANAVLAVPLGHRLEHAPQACLEDISGDELVTDQGRPILPHQTRVGPDWPQTDQTQIDVQLSTIAMRLVAKGNRVAICEPLSCEAFSQSIRFIPFRPQILLSYVGFHLRDQPVPATQTQFMDELKLAASDWCGRNPRLIGQD